MRTAFLLLGTLILLAGGFAVYLYVQESDGKRDATAATTQHVAQPIQDTDSTYTVRGGKDVWLKEFDESRRLTNQFRAAEFNPQKEGFVRVAKPEAHFFLRNGQWLRVTGETGDVVVPGMPEAGGKGTDPFAGGGGPAAAPSRGKLHDVRLQLYDNLASTKPMLDMEMNNAAFDNELFRIVTEAYTDESGKQIAADQVKVTVRGKYEFDGRGLMIRWNDLDRRLELLEIAHGERLIVKEPGDLGAGMPGSKASRKERDAAGMVTEVAMSSPLPIALASADPAGAAGAAITARKDSTIYSIFFFDNVQVTQTEKTLATGDVIEVFYAMRDEPEKSATQAAPQPAPAPAPAPAPPEPANVTPSTAPAATAPAPAPQEPIVIYWTGKLRIVPCTTEPPAKLAPGDSAVQMRGLPVVLTRDNAQIRCPGFTYRTADGGVTLNNSDAFPQVELKQFATVKLDGKPQLMLHSERVDYTPEAGVATLGGKSRAVFPADQGDPSAEPATATWTRQGVARFTGTGNDTVMQSLHLTGDVDVQHPQLSLKSQRLNLAFDPPAPDPAKPDARPQPVVRHVVADEGVQCVIVDEKGGPRELHGDHLDIETANDPAGKLYPKIVNARGNVRAFEEGQELTSQELALLLVPAAPKKTDARPKLGDKAAPAKSTSTAVQLQRMTAKTSVRAVSKDGDVATGDTLVVTTGEDGKPQIGLAGKPAKVTNAQGTVLTSTKIVIPNNEEAQAIGPGTLHAVTEDKDRQAPPQHMDVSWTGSALVNMKLKENHVQIVGDVKATMPEANGTMNTASADRMLITLVDKPPEPAKPTTKPAKAKAAKDAGTLAASEVDVMKSKQVSRILLNKDAVVNSRLTAADGTVLREMQIDSSLLSYSVLTKRMTVPRPGRMLVRDHRPPAEKRADADPQKEEDGLGSQRGATAFQWADALNYDGIEQRATMKGEVLIAYKPDAQGELPVRLRADEVIALFEEAPAVAGAAPPGEAVKAAGEFKAPPVRLRSVRAEGNVVVVRGGEELTAPRITYDPISHWIRAVGTDDVPAVFSAGRGSGTTAKEFQWNTVTWKMKAIGAAGRASGSGR